MSFNSDSVLEELDAFDNCESAGAAEDRDLSPVLEEYLTGIAKTGNIVFPWCKLKPVLKRKIDQVLKEFCKRCPTDTIPSLPNTEPFNYEALRKNIFGALDSFENAPFTIQRVCELLTNPSKHYNRTDKYMRGLEKNLLVVTTIDSKSVSSVEQEDAKSQPAMVNGISTDGVANNEHAYEHCTSNDLQPVHSSGTVLENFATVFPSAPHISNQPNNIQVAIVSGADSYQATQSMSTFTYCTDNGDEGFHDASDTPMATYESNGAAYCEPETEEKYIVIEELNSSEMNCGTIDSGFEDGAAEAAVSQCSDSHQGSITSDDGNDEHMIVSNDDQHKVNSDDQHKVNSDDQRNDIVSDEREEEEPNRKRRKFGEDPSNDRIADDVANGTIADDVASGKIADDGVACEKITDDIANDKIVDDVTSDKITDDVASDKITEDDVANDNTSAEAVAVKEDPEANLNVDVPVQCSEAETGVPESSIESGNNGNAVVVEHEDGE